MKKTPLSESAVPSGRFSRLSGLVKLASGVAGSMISQGAQQMVAGNRPKARDLLLSPANIQRLTQQLSEMRGAAMKVGQLLSMDGGDYLSPELTKILAQLRSDARPMPKKQLLGVLERNWGEGWQSQFKAFSYTPIAAASIGQVHLAQTHDDRALAIKVQYPGVRQSIRSDIDNIAVLLRVSNMIPRNLDISPLLEEAKRQLQDEADYLKESAHILRYRRLLADDADFVVPDVDQALTTKDVLAMTHVAGEALDELKSHDQAERDRVMGKLVELMFRELFEFNCMQTDPNFANYLYDASTGKIALLDFGATRSFDPGRVRAYRHLMNAGMASDAAAMEQAAMEIGYFDKNMKPAHRRLVLEILMAASEPLRHEGPYPCGKLGLGRRMNEKAALLGSDRNFGHIAPTETIFLHRKIGGIYMLGVQLNARIDFAGIYSTFGNPSA